METNYKYSEINNVFEKLISGNPELRQLFLEEIDINSIDQYSESNGGIPFVDVTTISWYIKEKMLKDETDSFEVFFENVEAVYSNCDKTVQNFIVVGLFESIQNVCPDEIDYYFSFNKWLKPESQKGWNEIIDYWEGKEWRVPKEERKKRAYEINKILNKKKKAK